MKRILRMPLAAHQEHNQLEARKLAETIHEVGDAVEGWYGPLTARQLVRLREATEALHRLANEIDEENWKRYGHA